MQTVWFTTAEVIGKMEEMKREEEKKRKRRRGKIRRRKRRTSRRRMRRWTRGSYKICKRFERKLKLRLTRESNMFFLSHFTGVFHPPQISYFITFITSKMERVGSKSTIQVSCGYLSFL